MSRHVVRTVALAIVMIVARPPAAAAGGILSWLGKMSGPGPFWGIDIGFCPDGRWHPGKRTAGDDAGSPRTKSTPTLVLCREKIEKGALTWYVTGGAAFASDNRLNYQDSSGPVKSRGVWTLKAATSLQYSALSSVDLGFEAGVLYFGGKSFDNFARPYLEPVVLTIRPGLWFCDGTTNSRCGAVLISGAWNKLYANLNGASFGAPGDSWHQKNESRLELGLGIDLYRLFSKK